jgi:hypothetical protein
VCFAVLGFVSDRIPLAVRARVLRGDDRDRGAGGAMMAQTFRTLVPGRARIRSRCCCWPGRWRGKRRSSPGSPSPGRVWTALVTGRQRTLVYHGSVTISARSRLSAGRSGRNSFAAAMARSVWSATCSSRLLHRLSVSRAVSGLHLLRIGTPSKIAFTFERLYPIVVACYFGFRAVQTRLIWSAKGRRHHSVAGDTSSGAAQHFRPACRPAGGDDVVSSPR